MRLPFLVDLRMFFICGKQSLKFSLGMWSLPLAVVGGGGGEGPSVLKFEQRGVQIHYVGDLSFIGMVLCAYLLSLFSL